MGLENPKYFSIGFNTKQDELNSLSIFLLFLNTPIAQ